jgi:hypothetical protein
VLVMLLLVVNESLVTVTPAPTQPIVMIISADTSGRLFPDSGLFDAQVQWSGRVRVSGRPGRRCMLLLVFGFVITIVRRCFQKWQNSGKLPHRRLVSEKVSGRMWS